MNPIVVHKYGGSSLADHRKVQRVAQRIVETVRSGKRVVAVVSAMGSTTDSLLAQAREVSESPNARELDMLLSVGERISTSLLAIAIWDLGQPAVSFTGSQSGIITNTRHNRARIIEVRPFRVMDELDANKVVIVAGYQGVSYAREITTLGRGGTDTTAVALAAALDAEYCEICSDVDGVYTADPRVVTDARRLDELGHEEMVALARAGARVLHKDCVEYASRHGVALFAKSTFGPRDDTGTLVRLNLRSEAGRVTAIAHRLKVGEVTLGATDRLEELLDCLAAHGAFAGQLHRKGELCHLLYDLEDVHQQESLSGALASDWRGVATHRQDRGTITLVGPGLGEEPELVRRALSLAQEEAGEPVDASLDSLSMTLTLPADKVPDTVRRLHAAFVGS